MKDEIINLYHKVSLEYGYNSNSLHKLGFDARKLESYASKQILDTLGLSNYDVIYTSGNSENFETISDNVKRSIYSNNSDLILLCKSKGISISNNFCDDINHIDIDLDKNYSDLDKYNFITIETCLPFFGVILKKKNFDMKNFIHGGKSTTKYRSGTAATNMIVCFAKIVKLMYKKNN